MLRGLTGEVPDPIGDGVVADWAGALDPPCARSKVLYPG